MRLSTKLLAGGALLLGLSGATAAMAASDARTTANLNIRVGPGVSYGYIDVIPQGTVIPVHGCLSDRDWCEVSFDGLRGWVSASYLMDPGQGYYYSAAPQIGVPIITFSFGDYHDRWYRDRPWHGHRHWAGRWHNRVDAREDRRDDRRDVRRERREDRREVRQDRREERRDARQERREERRDAKRDNRREERRDARRDDRREDNRNAVRERLEERREGLQNQRREVRQERPRIEQRQRSRGGNGEARRYEGGDRSPRR